MHNMPPHYKHLYISFINLNVAVWDHNQRKVIMSNRYNITEASIYDNDKIH
jgi:hypothetical protein